MAKEQGSIYHQDITKADLTVSPTTSKLPHCHSKREKENKKGEQKRRDRLVLFTVYVYIVCAEINFNKVFDFTAQKTRTVNQFIVRMCEEYHP